MIKVHAFLELIQLAVVMDSPTLGILISVAMKIVVVRKRKVYLVLEGLLDEHPALARERAATRGQFADASSGGDAVFARLGTEAGGVGGSWAWAPALFDLDLDGRLDVFNANGFVTGDTAADT